MSLILSLLAVSAYAEPSAEPSIISADINGDGDTDKNDAIYLLYSVLFGDDLYPVSGFSDFNCDGPVDKNDANVRLYYTDGSYVTRTGNSFPLDDFSYIKLVGKEALTA